MWKWASGLLSAPPRPWKMGVGRLARIALVLPLLRLVVCGVDGDEVPQPGWMPVLRWPVVPEVQGEVPIRPADLS